MDSSYINVAVVIIIIGLDWIKQNGKVIQTHLKFHTYFFNFESHAAVGFT